MLSTNSHLIRTFFYNKPMHIGREALLIEIHIVLRNIYCLEILTICDYFFSPSTHHLMNGMRLSNS